VQSINRSPLGFDVQTKKPSHWFWGINHQIIAVGFEVQAGKPPTTLFWDWIKEPTINFKTKSGETIATSFEAKQEKTIVIGFEVKPEKTVPKPLTNYHSGFEAKPLTNPRPWFWGSTKKLTLLVSTCTI
jgi:hypothetical protein